MSNQPPDLKDPVTRLGHCVALGPGQADHEPSGRRTSRRRHSHDTGRDWLRDVILGGQDGLVNILGIILGVVAGGGGRTVLLATGFAAAITESISMGAVGYTSTVADRDFYAAQRIAERAALVLGLVLSAAVLFGVGTYQAITRVGTWWKLGSRMVVIGLGAAAVGFAIGRLFHA